MPKQFIPLIGTASTFQQAIRRVDAPMFDEPVVVTNRDYRFLVREQLEEIGAKAQIVIEPARRDSGAAVAVAAEIGAARDPQTVVAVFAADHVVLDQKGFLAACATAAEAAAVEGAIVTLGVTPTEPAIGYGYIRPGDSLGVGDARRVAAFVEKPNLATAKRYVAEGYLWNSGNFFFRADAMLSELRAFEPEMVEATEAALAAAREDLGFLILDKAAFERSPKKSIDYAVMERTHARRGGAGRHRLVGRRQLGRGVEAQPARRQRQRHPWQRLRLRVEERPYPFGRPADGGGRRRRRHGGVDPGRGAGA